MKLTHFSKLAITAILLSFAVSSRGDDGLQQSKTDCLVKLGEITGEYKNEPDPRIELGDIEDGSGAETPNEELNDLMREYEFLMWKVEADDFFWGTRQQLSIDLLNR